MDLIFNSFDANLRLYMYTILRVIGTFQGCRQVGVFGHGRNSQALIKFCLNALACLKNTSNCKSAPEMQA